ncbi:hypothetical protein SAMN05444487_111138 [Marininema mesophilum]|uniref:Uncharacterized protein n=1 Tax=Marininema mesophilum TaxID=1048340 RepID=A0A1H2ZN52_9BACL|nr:hypothetical protein [Marininema mesophilum]SDX18837.1 hypothetical protein SAMN05444487_111138 [Marininema mesophilum]
MDASSSPSWLITHLESRFSGEELENILGCLQAESWASPSERRRRWSQETMEIPLRFQLELDMEV